MWAMVCWIRNSNYIVQTKSFRWNIAVLFIQYPYNKERVKVVEHVVNFLAAFRSLLYIATEDFTHCVN